MINPLKPIRQIKLKRAWQKGKNTKTKLCVEDDATKLPTFNCESFSADENCEGKPRTHSRLRATHSRCVKLLPLALKGQWEWPEAKFLTYVRLMRSVGCAVISCCLSSASCVLTFLLVEYSLTARSIAPTLWGL